MTLSVKITPQAQRDLLAIKAYIAERNPSAAERVRSRIARTIDIMAEFPNMGRATKRPGVLMALVPRYHFKVYYAVAGDVLQVVHVRHPSRQEPQADEL
jgi:plasmid stabilization system protein ParE